MNGLYERLAHPNRTKNRWTLGVPHVLTLPQSRMVLTHKGSGSWRDLLEPPTNNKNNVIVYVCVCVCVCVRQRVRERELL